MHSLLDESAAQHLAGADAAAGPQSAQGVLLWWGRGAAPLSSMPLGRADPFNHGGSMGPPGLDPHLLARHQAELGQMDVESLLQLWATSLDGDWTPEGLQAVRSILQDRVGYVPERKPMPQDVSTSDPDSYHDRDRLITLSVRLSSLSWVFLVLAGLALFPIAVALVNWASTDWAGPFSAGEWLQFYGGTVVNGLQSAIVSLALFLVARIGSEMVFLMMDVEYNTRPK